MIHDYVECPADHKVPKEHYGKKILFSLLLKYLTYDEATKYYLTGVASRNAFGSFSFRGDVTFTSLLNGINEISFSDPYDEERYILYQKSLPTY